MYLGISHYLSDRKSKGRRKNQSDSQQGTQGFVMGNTAQSSEVQRRILSRGIYLRFDLTISVKQLDEEWKYCIFVTALIF